MAHLNRQLFRKAERYLVGGVDSPVRSFCYAGVEALLIKKGRGSVVWDYDSKKYIDYVLSWGSLILGHAHPLLLQDLKRAVDSGLGFGVTHASEIELAQRIQRAVPFIEKIRFVNSGTEAVMGAVRVARGHTGRDKVLKFKNAYHGHADYLLTRGGSGLATLNIASSSGVPKDFLRQTVVAPYGDREFIERLFERDGSRIAAVLVEPVGGNDGVVVPDRDFLKELRRLTRKYGALLIFDEVITGFRFNFGAFARELAITPDLICLGKIIGGGLPIGAYGGPEKIMTNLTPEGRVYQASTFSGNPIVMQAGISTLKELERRKNDYARLRDTTQYLASMLKGEARRRGIELDVTVFGAMFSLKFANKENFRAFYRRMLKRGVFLAPSEFEVNFLSFAHTQENVDKTIHAAKNAFTDLKRRENEQ